MSEGCTYLSSAPKCRCGAVMKYSKAHYLWFCKVDACAWYIQGGIYFNDETEEAVFNDS